MAKTKPRIIKNYEKLDEAMRNRITDEFPDGYQNHILTFDVGGGKFLNALPFETDEYSYLIKFPPKEELDLDDGVDLGQDDEMHLEGGIDQDEEEEKDDLPEEYPEEESVGSLQDLANAEDAD